MRLVFTTEITPVILLAVNEDIVPVSCVEFVQMLSA
jgi:hypothetical protein